jgi:hypothetical protein
MQYRSFILGTALALSLLSIGCTGQTGQSASTDSTQIASLPLLELEEGDEVAFENDAVRIVEGKTIETEGGVYNTIKVQPKRSGSDIKTFELEGTILTFEGVVGHTLLTSEGTGAICPLSLYDLATGKEVMPIDLPFDSGEGVEVVDANTFYFYTYDEAYPTMTWDKQKGVWVDQNKVPDALRNDQLKELQAKLQLDLFDGSPLMALRKVEVKLQERKVTPLDEYRWSVIE